LRAGRPIRDSRIVEQSADTNLMTKAQITLLSTALFGVVALMLLMAHLLAMKPEKKAEGPVVAALVARFTPMLAKEPMVVVRDAVTKEKTDDRPEEAEVAVIVKIHPKSTEGLERIVEEISEFVWSSRFEGRSVRSVTAQWRDPHSGDFTAVRMKKPGKRKVLDLFIDLPEAPAVGTPAVPGR
jgi:hypothetical protein